MEIANLCPAPKRSKASHGLTTLALDVSVMWTHPSRLERTAQDYAWLHSPRETQDISQ